MKGRLIFPILLILLLSTYAFADYVKGGEAYKSGDYVTALKEWEPLAEQGDAVAQYGLGLMYYKGQGVTQDYKLALKWTRLVAEQGHAMAQLVLGVMYQKGDGVTQDYIRAHMWFNIAASQGSLPAMTSRNTIQIEMTSADISKAQDLFRECVVKSYKDC